MIRSSVVLLLTLLAACSGDKDTGDTGSPADTDTDTDTDTDADTDADADADSDTDTDTDTDTAVEHSVTGAAIVYVAWTGAFTGPGIDGRNPVDATFLGSDLVAYTWPTNPVESPEIGTCSAEEVGVHRSMTWGRWADGTTAGDFFGNTFTLTADQGFHHVVAVAPSTSPPFGVDATYVQVGATSPSAPAGATGSVSAEVVVTAGDPPLIALQLTANAGGSTMTAETPGYPSTAAAATGAFGGLIFDNGVPATGCSGTGACTLTYRGVFADDGETLGISYTIGQEQVHGVVVLERL